MKKREREGLDVLGEITLLRCMRMLGFVPCK
jgi:hypothetical protein